MASEGLSTLRSLSQSVSSEQVTAQRRSVQNSDDIDHYRFFLPCHYFDYAAGTSTGGYVPDYTRFFMKLTLFRLISIMLSRFRMSVDDCISEYEALGQDVFGHPRPFAKAGFLWSKYSYRALESAIEKVTRKHSKTSEFDVHYPLDEDVCKWYDSSGHIHSVNAYVVFLSIVLAIANYTGADAPYLFRTYDTEAPPSRIGSRDQTNYGQASNLPISRVARATSAAPGYFREIEIPGGNVQDVKKFMDGGFGSNNPSYDAYRDIVHKHGGMHSSCMGPFVSIGTGHSRLEMFSNKSGNPRRALTNLKSATKLPSRSFKAHVKMQDMSEYDGRKVFPYYRFDGGEILGKIPMDAWEGDKFKWLKPKRNLHPAGYKTLAQIKDATAIYLQDRHIRDEIKKCAEDLVYRRRLRTRDCSKWDRYASFSYYTCDETGCQTPRMSTADAFKEHLRSSHSYAVSNKLMNDKLERCRRVNWVYRHQDTNLLGD